MKRLIEIQNELKAPKNQRNNFGGYNYRSCEDILEAVKPLLRKHGLALVIEDDIINVGDRYYIKANACLFTEDNKLLTHCTAFAREEDTQKGMSASQLTGSTSSYARKYALNGLFAIDDNKDADATNTHDKEPKKAVTVNNNDLDIIEGLKACDNMQNLIKYKDAYKDKVEDVMTFKAEYAKMYHKFKKKQEA